MEQNKNECTYCNALLVSKSENRACCCSNCFPKIVAAYEAQSRDIEKLRNEVLFLKTYKELYDSWNDGYTAAHRGTSKEDNPYDKLSSIESWEYGWTAGKIETEYDDVINKIILLIADIVDIAMLAKGNENDEIYEKLIHSIKKYEILLMEILHDEKE